MNPIRPTSDEGVLLDVSPEAAGWTYLSFRAVRLPDGERLQGDCGAREVALVPIQGAGTVRVGGDSFRLGRASVFTELPSVLYLPPGTGYTVEAAAPGFEFTVGGAPAEGRYPLRLFRPEEMRVEMRGGANAYRQVSHILGPHLPAERLYLFEVYTPSGFWSGWPPHRHDGEDGSAYVEEVYYYKVQPAHGWGIHRNYTADGEVDDLMLVRDGDLVLVPRGFHPVVAPPGSNLYYLNYMAGELQDGARATPPVDDADWAWMREDWEGKPVRLPIRAKS
ncbi:MAG TPA: 5-deoxy-glucuronate isomerase [Trueperaceae bacterium]|nr:5-deoxy-glucuronate isomerase [Trueperaceae bacterium]